MSRIHVIQEENFSKYGTILAFPPDSDEAFHIVAREEEQPWRIAVFRYENKEIQVLENHPTSMESFEPLQGITILVTAENKSPDKWEAFLLDKPVCLHKGIWHQVLSLTEKAQVKITENLEVSSEFYQLEEIIEVQVASKNHKK